MPSIPEQLDALPLVDDFDRGESPLGEPWELLNGFHNIGLVDEFAPSGYRAQLSYGNGEESERASGAKYGGETLGRDEGEQGPGIKARINADHSSLEDRYFGLNLKLQVAAGYGLRAKIRQQTDGSYDVDLEDWTGAGEPVTVLATVEGVTLDEGEAWVAMYVLGGKVYMWAKQNAATPWEQIASAPVDEGGAFITEFTVVGGLDVAGNIGRLRDVCAGTIAEETPAAAAVSPVTIDYGSDRWAYAIARPHRLAVEATLIDGDTETELTRVVDGSVTLDANAAIRGRLDLTLADPGGAAGILPSDAGDSLAPYGSEIRVSRGIEYPEGDRELEPLGVYRIEDVDVDDKGDGLELRVSGLDRSKRIQDARFEEPYEVAAGTNYATAIEEVLVDAYPDIETDFTSTSRTTPHLVAEEGDDRWAFAQEMADSIGCELYFDGEGVCILESVTNPGASSPDWELVEGEGGVLVSAARRWTREGTYNRVIATGENVGETETPARGVATDDDPNSPTYYLGPFGRVPRFYRSEFIVTDSQAFDAAQAQLARELGTTQQIDFGSIVNPKIQPNSTVRVSRARAGIDQEDHIVDQVTIPLSAAGAMSGQTRSTQVT